MSCLRSSQATYCPPVVLTCFGDTSLNMKVLWPLFECLCDPVLVLSIVPGRGHISECTIEVSGSEVRGSTRMRFCKLYSGAYGFYKRLFLIESFKSPTPPPYLWFGASNFNCFQRGEVLAESTALMFGSLTILSILDDDGFISWYCCIYCC